MKFVRSTSGFAAILGLAAAHAMAQMTLVSQNRHVHGHAACSGMVDEERHDTEAPGLFDASVSVGAGDDQTYAYMQASQASMVSTSSITGSVATGFQSRFCAGSACSSVCEVTFDIGGSGAVVSIGAEYTYAGKWASFGLLQLHAGQSLIYDEVVLPGRAVERTLVLIPGRYTFRANAYPFHPRPGPAEGGSGMDFAFHVQSLPSPAPDGPVVRRAGTCHRYVRLSPATWLAARDTALAMGGYLVTIDDAEEEAFIASEQAIYEQMAFIGLSDPDGDGVFAWMNAAPLKYTNWDTGEPGGQYASLVGNPGFTSWYARGPAPGGDALLRSVVEFDSCPCDWTLDAAVTSSDFFAFLADFFGGDADLNCSGTTDSADFFEFLTCFFAPECGE